MGIDDVLVFWKLVSFMSYLGTKCNLLHLMIFRTSSGSADLALTESSASNNLFRR